MREISFDEKYLAVPRVHNHYSVCTIACGETLIARMRDRGEEDRYLAVITGRLFASSPVFLDHGGGRAKRRLVAGRHREGEVATVGTG
ncbi:hypothetical protein pRL110338 (plasmid) [Rhizobium johnstonii 3841]|uniref:Uncharacterized protein n=1 Tax=Rhizobium johnstonii (strain DSM 114642 / LMG 32736 / 3841) TaxID=216596 RepID=Q1M650_RHIJ3|nr:hypothetical protein pRL110338 [Rhizobium johnstonii 3841]